MIKKAQIKFISLTMSILLAMFGVLFLTTAMILRANKEKNIENVLDDTVKNYAFFNDTNVYKSFLVKVAFNPATNKNENVILCIDENSFSLDNAQRIINLAIESNYSKGKIGVYCYKNYTINHTTFIAVTDSTNFSLSYSSALVKTSIAISISFFILFIIVYVLSFRIFKPVKEAFLSKKRSKTSKIN